MSINWVRAFNRLFELIDSSGDAYYSGGRFISKVREIDPYFHDYGQYMAERKKSRKSTSRRDYFYDILLDFQEDDRLRLLSSIIEDVRDEFPEKTRELEAELGIRDRVTDLTHTLSSEAVPEPQDTSPAEPTTDMYHETKSATGQIFKSSEVPSLEKKGWVDSPAKFGKGIRSKFRRFARVLRDFWLEHWKWIIGTTIAAAAVVVTYLTA